MWLRAWCMNTSVETDNDHFEKYWRSCWICRSSHQTCKSRTVQLPSVQQPVHAQAWKSAWTSIWCSHIIICCSLVCANNGSHAQTPTVAKLTLWHLAAPCAPPPLRAQTWESSRTSIWCSHIIICHSLVCANNGSVAHSQTMAENGEFCLGWPLEQWETLAHLSQNTHIHRTCPWTHNWRDLSPPCPGWVAHERSIYWWLGVAVTCAQPQNPRPRESVNVPDLDLKRPKLRTAWSSCARSRVQTEPQFAN